VLAVLLGLAVSRAAAAAPRRVISLNPSLTAMVLAVGARDRLVGVDDFSAQEEPSVASLPRVGGLYNPSLEAVVALRPDLVLLVPSAEQRDFRERLAALRIPVLALDPVRFDEVVAALETVGERLGCAAAAHARADAERRALALARELTAGLPRPRVVLVLQRDPLYVAGGGSFIDEMIQAAGGRNLGAAFSEPYPRVSQEWLIEAAPDRILDSSNEPGEARSFWARWPSLPALTQRGVAVLPAGLVTLPGPWLDRALAALVRAIHGLELALPEGDAADGAPPAPGKP
jgi:iron complex transport system substrate-binding protein